MHVHNVELTATGKPPRGAHAGQHIERRHQFVANRVTNAVYGPLIVSQIFPAAGEVAEPVYGDAFVLLIPAATVGGGEDFDVQSRGALPS